MNSLTLRERLSASAKSALYDSVLAALPRNMTGHTGTIDGLFIAPIKSCGMLSLSEALITPKGLATTDGEIQDRGALLLYDNPGKHGDIDYRYGRFTQREVGALTLVRPTYNTSTRIVTYEAPDMPPLKIHADELKPRKGKTEKLKMFSDGGLHETVVENGWITAWIRSFLKRHKSKYDPDRVSVGIQPEGFTREVSEDHRFGHQAFTAYSDGDEILAANLATLAMMNGHLHAQYGLDFREVEMPAFRPEIVLRGIPAASEDVIGSILINNETELVLTCHCVRCPVTQVDQATGDKPDKEPLAYLAKNRPHRHDSPNGATFGWNALFTEASWGKVIGTDMRFSVLREQS